MMGASLLVLAPTRELATQIEVECQKFGLPLGIRSVCCYGGAPKGEQLMKMRQGCQVIIGTPGRINDFRESNQINLSQINYLVMDEADRMLDMGFEPQIRKIVACVPPVRRPLLRLFACTCGYPCNSVKLPRRVAKRSSTRRPGHAPSVRSPTSSCAIQSRSKWVISIR